MEVVSLSKASCGSKMCRWIAYATEGQDSSETLVVGDT